MKPIDMLKEARALVAQGWCQKTAATDAEGFRRNVTDDKACRWCATGAFECVQWRKDGQFTTYDDRHASYALLCAAIDQLGYPMYRPSSRSQSDLDGARIQLFNDASDRTQDQVVEAFDLAIGLAEEE